MEGENSKKTHKALFIFITIGCLFLTIIGKLYSMGWFTIICTLFGIIPAQLILFTIAGIFFANMDNKTIGIYIIYIFLCITSLLYSYTFVDFGDMGGSYTALNLHILSNDLLNSISIISYISNIVLSIILIVKRQNNKKRYLKINRELGNLE